MEICFEVTIRHVMEDDHDGLRHGDYAKESHHIVMLELCQHVCLSKKVFANGVCGALCSGKILPKAQQQWSNMITPAEHKALSQIYT